MGKSFAEYIQQCIHTVPSEVSAQCFPGADGFEISTLGSIPLEGCEGVCSQLLLSACLRSSRHKKKNTIDWVA